MMHACASAAKLRGGGPILTRGSKAIVWVGIPPPRTVLGSLPRRRSGLRTENSSSALGGAQVTGARRSPARPHRWSPNATARSVAFARGRRSWFCACRRGARPIPLRQRALLLEQEKAPRELEHAAAHTGVAHLGQAPLPPFGAALVGRAGQASVARQRPPVPQVAGGNPVPEHVRGLDANADPPGQQAHHGLGPRGRSLLEPFDPGLLDLFDLIPHKAQARHVAAQLGQRIWAAGRPPPAYAPPPGAAAWC